MNLKQFFLFFFFLFFVVSHSYSKDYEKSAQLRGKMSYFLSLIDQMYVDSFSLDKVIDAAIIKSLQELDPHSRYIKKEKVTESEESLKGGFEGIGIQFSIEDDTIFVVKPLIGGPSSKLGISAGDKIIFVDGENVAGTGITNTGVRNRLKGKKGTKVVVKIKREGFDSLLLFTIIRDKIPIYSIEGHYMINDTIGYIRINEFSITTNKEFIDAFDSLSNKGMKRLILDITGNGGGYLNSALQLVDHFLPEKELILYTEGKSSPKREFHASDIGVFEKGKLLIMIDQYSASASEIVSGAIQDWDRGLVIGRRSFGKGLVQQPFDLPDKSSVRLTISRYYIPSGRFIQKPYGDGYEEYNQELSNRFLKGELFSEDSISHPDSLLYYTNKGRKMYGGGGIFPDYFVPIDTTKVSPLWLKVRRNTSMFSFVLRYFNSNKKSLKKKYKDFQVFLLDSSFDEKMLSGYLDYLKEKYKVEPENDEDLEKSRKYLLVYLKGYLAGSLFTRSEQYYIFNTVSDIYKKATELISDDEAFEKKGITR